MAVTSTQTSLNTTAAQIAAPAVDSDVHIFGIGGSGAVYLGGSGVSSANGYPLQGARLTVALNAGEALYGVTQSDTATVAVLVIPRP